LRAALQSFGLEQIRYHLQRGSLQLFASLKTGSTLSLPQIFLPARLGFFGVGFVPLQEISVNRLFAFIDGLVVAVVYDSLRHATEDGLDDVQVRGQLNQRSFMLSAIGIVIHLINLRIELLGDMPRRRIP